MQIQNIEKFVELIRESHDELLNKSSALEFDNFLPQHHFAITLYGSILEITTSILVLIETKTLAGVPILLRTLLEGYVDLKNLVNDEDYSKNIKASNLKEWLRVFRAASKQKNPYLKAIKEMDELDSPLANWDKEYTDLVNEGRRELSAFDKFNLAGMGNEYRSIYNFLCSESHNNMRSLIARHVDIDEAEEEIKLVYYKDISLSDIDHYIQMIGTILVNSSVDIHRLLETTEFENTEKIAGNIDHFVRNNISPNRVREGD